MEGVVMTRAAARKPACLATAERRFFLTGHTGFKGTWLAETLLQAGAHVEGYALPPEEPDGLFAALDLATRLQAHTEADIRDLSALTEAVQRAQPEVVLHLAAQALVLRSYREPIPTWATNVMGTLHLLEAVRSLGRPVTVVVVTSDKVYHNNEWEFGYREQDALGGLDPYSSSKAACEILVNSWRASYAGESGVRVVTARAGNVIGGGDQAENRIVPDCYRAWDQGKPVELRNPMAIRPWQHVLEPLGGYLSLAAHAEAGGDLTTCNFGPESSSHQTVESLVDALAGLGTGRSWRLADGQTPHEARTLSLSIDRAAACLDWRPQLDFTETIRWTDEWYSAPVSERAEVTRRQIAEYQRRVNASRQT